MKRFFGMGIMLLAVLGLLLSACGEATPTPAPAASGTMMAKTTEPAMMKPTDAAMMTKTTEPAMMKPTDGAMMAKTTEPAMMTKTTEPAMTKPTRLGGTFNNQGAEPVAGKAILGKTTDGKLILRFEDLKSANGPDLFVYLTKEAAPSNANQIKAGLEVAKLKATQGSQNYEIDPMLDLTQYKSVAIYCKSFSVVFGYANLTSEVS